MFPFWNFNGESETNGQFLFVLGWHLHSSAALAQRRESIQYALPAFLVNSNNICNVVCIINHFEIWLNTIFNQVWICFLLSCVVFIGITSIFIVLRHRLENNKGIKNDKNQHPTFSNTLNSQIQYVLSIICGQGSFAYNIHFIFI